MWLTLYKLAQMTFPPPLEPCQIFCHESKLSGRGTPTCRKPERAAAPVATTIRGIPSLSMSSRFCRRSPVGIWRPCSRTTPVRQHNARRRTGEKSEDGVVDAGEIEEMACSANTSELPAPHAIENEKISSRT